ncbi:HAD family hydrolase [Actinorugispora endophytica]|uniref:Putative hydrolase of the HAD superfamily n=1 Tax=Actinorugispora endophytica TaxID=1605990 RepID=A0A4R6V6E6_9ACTN|nr:HAD family hydrolase [Actinorugispora endophytica]TDQ54445.1 putative hydrolase of the HAD superfamily [Actinorugispora endophytica]
MRPAALFDLDDTLIDRRTALDTSVAAFCDLHGLNTGARTWLLAALEDRATPEHFAPLSQRYGLAMAQQDLWTDYRRIMARSVACFPGVLDGLGELRSAGWAVGVLTNGASDIQRAKLRSAGLSHLVDAVAVSGETGIRKPAVEAFHTAMRSLEARGRSPGWMVGDGPVNDIRGGCASGLRTVWVSHGRSWPGKHTVPDRIAADTRSAISTLLSASA